MPELPDLTVYVEALNRRLQGKSLRALRIGNPFVLRTVIPSPADLAGKTILGISRLSKQIVIGLEGDNHIVIHLMIAGRLRWREAVAAKLPKRRGLAAFDFDSATLLFTEEGSKRRASIHLVQGKGDLSGFDRGGLEPLESSLESFRKRLSTENHTLKRALTDQRMLAGIGNAYSDEILLAARLSPFKQTRDLDDEQWQRLFLATRETLTRWTHCLREECGDGFPEKVTAFREGMAVHGRYRKPCPECGSPVQRIVYAQNEANYCARCQTGGRMLADRALSRLLKANWPKTIDELEM